MAINFPLRTAFAVSHRQNSLLKILPFPAKKKKEKYI
jgi:hypothetical protein